MNQILELIFKGLIQWLFDLIINITEYLSNALLDVFKMDLSYFETAVPVTSDIVTIMICVGWALLLGNLIFQATKSMATGLGIDGEEPQMLFTRTFVMGFFLLASRQICDIGLGITKTVITMLQIPTIVQIPKMTESTFAVPNDAGWLLCIIVGMILIVQIIKLFFEIGERYVVVAILTILSPLAFAMGGSKNTSDIFKGWARMFGSMCLMMILSVVFLKLILSAMSVVPTNTAVIPWLIFVVAIAKTGRKIDSMIARVGLNPAITGDSLGHSRMPGMLTMMVARNVMSDVKRTAAANRSSASKTPGGAAPVSQVNPSAGAVSPSHSISPRATTDKDYSVPAVPTAPPPAVRKDSGSGTGAVVPSSHTAAHDGSSVVPASRDTKAVLPITAERATKGTDYHSTAAASDKGKDFSSIDASHSATSGTPTVASTIASRNKDTMTSTSRSTSKPIPPRNPTADTKASNVNNSSTGTSSSTATALADKPTRPPIGTRGTEMSAKADIRADKPTPTATRPPIKPSDSIAANKNDSASVKGGNISQKTGDTSNSQSNTTNISATQKAVSQKSSSPTSSATKPDYPRPPATRMPAINNSVQGGGHANAETQRVTQPNMGGTPNISGTAPSQGSKQSAESRQTPQSTNRDLTAKSDSSVSTIKNKETSFKGSSPRPNENVQSGMVKSASIPTEKPPTSFREVANRPGLSHADKGKQFNNQTSKIPPKPNQKNNDGGKKNE